jgi:Cupin domain
VRSLASVQTMSAAWRAVRPGLSRLRRRSSLASRLCVSYVLEGEHVFQVGGAEFRVGPGGFAFAPRGIPHAQRRVVPRTGRVLVLTSPAGFEGFFRELADADRDGKLGPDAYAGASKAYGVTWL